jgi:hypothetical protein
MTTWAALRPAAVLLLLLGLTACAEQGAATDPPPPDAAEPAAESGLVLQVERTGGFVMPGTAASQLPSASVYADGRAVVPGPVAAIHPGFAWPSLQVRDVGRDGVQALVDRALAAGVAETTDLGSPPLADAPTTRFTLVTAEATYVREVYALFGTSAGGVDGLTTEQLAARQELFALASSLGDLALGTVDEEPPPAYVPEAVAAVVRPWAPSDEDIAQGFVPTGVPWPGPPLPGEPLGALPGLTCVTASGDEGRAVAEAARDANMLTPWIAADGSRWSVTFRPLLPHESGCADLME